ncbi:hypothetical protein ABZZ74_51965 [Streptomyces sp. NPDC006476]|uniref:hypothetical protein n=1 Tax=Streptomyces sp. NPDC006476 TaxID=3157175 RepID=UPI0033A8CB1C
MISAFSRRLLDLESRIDSRKLGWYSDNFDEPVMDYWRVERPGRLVRDPTTGAPVTERITIAEFLARTGVADLFVERDTVGITAVQAAVVNPWGFVGFQFGEALLTDLQYYRPMRGVVVLDGEEIKVPSYYAPALPESTWCGGTTSHVYHDEDINGPRIGTDVNEWRGTFTGRDGIDSFADLRRYDNQLAVLRRALRHNARILNRHFAKSGRDLWSSAESSPASLLGAAHLCGPYGVLAYLDNGIRPTDEAGTSITAYLRAFSDVELTPDDLGAQ